MQSDFVLQDKFSKTLSIGIEKVFEMGYNDMYKETVSVSDITQCDRRIYYRFLQSESSKSGREQKDRNHFLLKWLDTLQKTKNFKLLNKELTVADHNHNVFSTIDFVGSIDDLPVVVMIKEVSDDIFQSNNAKRPHVVQIMTQMWLAEINDGFLIYESIVTKKHNVFHILPNVSVLNAVKNKLLNLRDCKMSGTLPDRKYETADSDECKQCCFTEKCWRLTGDG